MEVAPNADPPVCRLMDYGKYLYEKQKQRRESRKAQKQIEVKEVRLRPKTDEHDVQVVLTKIRKFVKDGAKVRVRIRFHGREMQHPEVARAQLERVAKDVADVTTVESMPLYRRQQHDHGIGAGSVGRKRSFLTRRQRRNEGTQRKCRFSLCPFVLSSCQKVASLVSNRANVVSPQEVHQRYDQANGHHHSAQDFRLDAPSQPTAQYAPPRMAPIAITSAADQTTWPEVTKNRAAATLTLKATACFNALSRVSESSITNPKTAKMMTLNPAPK